MLSDLESTTVFVSGAQEGIGAAIVRAFASQRERVAFIDLDDASAKVLLMSSTNDVVRALRCSRHRRVAVDDRRSRPRLGRCACS